MEDDGEPTIRLRSYRPTSERLKPLVHARSDATHHRDTPQQNTTLRHHKPSAAASIDANAAGSDARVDDTDSSGAIAAERLALGDNLVQPIPVKLAPSSRNQDLKRDIKPQMETLHALTDEAIVHLIRECVESPRRAHALLRLVTL